MADFLPLTLSIDVASRNLPPAISKDTTPYHFSGEIIYTPEDPAGYALLTEVPESTYAMFCKKLVGEHGIVSDDYHCMLVRWHDDIDWDDDEVLERMIALVLETAKGGTEGGLPDSAPYYGLYLYEDTDARAIARERVRPFTRWTADLRVLLAYQDLLAA